ncbi:MAG: ribosome maturation factor RimM [Acidaminococcaceae bacterium]
MDKRIIIGAIVAPHGVRGEFRVMPLTENPDMFLELKYFFLEDGRKLFVTASRFHKNVFLVKVEEINNMNEAELLRGKKILIDTANLPPLKEDQFYVSDLIGFAVYDEAGLSLGKLKDVLATGSNDVFIVQANDGSEILIPALKANIKEINMADNRILVKLPEWAE